MAGDPKHFLKTGTVGTLYPYEVPPYRTPVVPCLRAVPPYRTTVQYPPYRTPVPYPPYRTRTRSTYLHTVPVPKSTYLRPVPYPNPLGMYTVPPRDAQIENLDFITLKN